MRKTVLLLMFAWAASFAENYLINGGQEATFHYRLTQKVVPPPMTSKLILSFVVPQNFSSPTYNQQISDFSLTFSANPRKRKQEKDKRGNLVITAEWKNPHTIETSLSMTAKNRTNLVSLNTTGPFPPARVPKKLRDYLSATDQVQASNSQLRKKARDITADAKTQFDAVQQILSWIVDHMSYVLRPEKYDALYSFRTGKGNCQNYSHLAAAMMRSVGIPVRIVNGITLENPYDIKTDNGVLTMKMAQGRHSWIEVWFPDLDWVPFDPQQLEMFVSNRFIRAEIGVDNDETEKDGLIRWTTDKGIKLQPLFEENIEATFVQDQANLTARKQNYGPKKLLLCPGIETSFTRQPVIAPPPPPPPPAQKTMHFTRPFLYGNLDYPQNLDFSSARGDAVQGTGGEMILRKNFLVETAEYVTTRGNQYAQTFELNKPVQVTKAGLALNVFGGSGQIWLELYKDDGAGKPGQYLATSELLDLSSIPRTTGYNWVDFGFSPQILQPGRYWLALGFTGSPVVNWFFSYGKPVGPIDGTRYKTMFDETWSRSLNYEFNYRVMGLAAE